MKVLLLSITAGEGHNSTAKAIADELKQRGAECKILDTLKYINKILGSTVANGYLLALKNAKFAYAKTYGLLEKRKNKDENSFSAVRFANKILSKKLKNYIIDYDPDVIICTHIFACNIVEVLKRKGVIRSKIIGILTDFTFHPYWEESAGIDYVVTADSGLTFQAYKKGYEDSQILPIGIPINPKFSITVPKEDAREQLGIDKNKLTLLIMGGSMGFGDFENTVAELDNINYDFQMITVCGNNKEAKELIDSKTYRKEVLNLGYVDYVNLLMDAADCIVTKPGGLTSSEALAKGLPMIMVNPIPGQEDRNVEFLTNNGAGMSVTKTFPIEQAIYQFVSKPERVAIMKKASLLIGKPNATKDLADFVMTLEK